MKTGENMGVREHQHVAGEIAWGSYLMLYFVLKPGIVIHGLKIRLNTGKNPCVETSHSITSTAYNSQIRVGRKGNGKILLRCLVPAEAKKHPD